MKTKSMLPFERYDKNDSRGLSCGITLNIHQDILKCGNLLHRWAFIHFQFDTTVSLVI